MRMQPKRYPWALALVLVSSLLLAHARAADDYFPPPDSEGGWRTLKDEAEIRKVAGMDARRLAQAFEFTQRCTQNGGLLVVHHGYGVYEGYFGRAHCDANPDMAS